VGTFILSLKNITMKTCILLSNGHLVKTHQVAVG